jgi:hypothetical protein
MTANPLEIRVARLEGAFEQVNERIGALERRVDQGFNAMDRRLEAIDRRFEGIDQRFNLLFGTILATWITTILTVLFHH